MRKEKWNNEEMLAAVKEFNKRRYEYLKKHKKTNKPFNLKPYLFKKRIFKQITGLYEFYIELLHQPEFFDNSDMAYEIFYSFVKDIQLKYDITDSDLKLIIISVRNDWHEHNTI